MRKLQLILDRQGRDGFVYVEAAIVGNTVERQGEGFGEAREFTCKGNACDAAVAWWLHHLIHLFGVFPRAPRVTVSQGEKRGGRKAEGFNGNFGLRSTTVEDA